MRGMSPIRLVAICACFSVLTACANSTPIELFSASGRVWPEAPDQERIAYLGSFSEPGDLDIHGGIWGSFVSLIAGSSERSMQRPMAVAVSPDGRFMFVADPDAGCVHRYDLARSRYACMVAKPGLGRLSPIGLAVSDGGRLFVTDSVRGQILTAGPEDRVLSSFQVSIPLGQPTGIFWRSGDRKLLVTDTARQSIVILDDSGRVEQLIGERGLMPGQFNFPTYLWVSRDEELLVTDSLNFRLQRFGQDGRVLGVFGKNGDLPGDFSRPKGVATDSHGHVYVVDALMHSVQIFSKDGELLLNFGERGRDEGQFWLPNGIFITQDDTIYVADSYNKRVQVFRYVGPAS